MSRCEALVLQARSHHGVTDHRADQRLSSQRQIPLAVGDRQRERHPLVGKPEDEPSGIFVRKHRHVWRCLAGLVQRAASGMPTSTHTRIAPVKSCAERQA